jgi:two-component SAPR family response regulator
MLSSDRTGLYFLMAFVQVAAWLALGCYVLTRRPRQPISWVFAVLCLGMANFYLTTIFLATAVQPLPATTPMAMRLKWAFNSLSPAVFFHLTWFYFPESWRTWGRRLLGFLYLFAAVLATSALATDWMVSGAARWPDTPFYITVPGPFMRYFLVFLGLALIVGIIGLVVGYRRSRSLSIRRQIIYLLAPIAAITITPLLSGYLMFTELGTLLAELLLHVLLLGTAVSFSRAVLLYGSFVGRPASPVVLLRPAFTWLALGSLFAVTIMLDRNLAATSPLPLPMLTILALVLLIVSYPAIREVSIKILAKWLPDTTAGGREVAQQLALRLTSDAPDPRHLQEEFLTTLCLMLRSRFGVLAVYPANDSPELVATVRLAVGETAAKAGDVIPVPSDIGERAHLVITMQVGIETEAAIWQEAAVVCPLMLDAVTYGLLLVGEKRNQAPYSYEELVFCDELADRLALMERTVQLRQEQNRYLERVYEYEKKLDKLREQALATTDVVAQPQKIEAAPVAIRVLGVLAVYRHGRRVQETEWGGEKAKGMLAYLLWKSRDGATREELCDMLWPERPLAEVANVFHVTLHRLRRVLEPGRGRGSSYVIHQGNRYRFNRQAPHWLDEREFLNLVQQKETSSLKEAVELYRGCYLDDLAWALPAEAEGRRRRLEQHYQSALRQVAAQVCADQAEPYLQRLIAVEPADEAANRALIDYYLARGRHDLAQQHEKQWQTALLEYEAGTIRLEEAQSGNVEARGWRRR